jgi:O-antigen/teichoic acid export membrane protein
MARLLGSHVFGLFSLSWMLVRVVGTLTPLGLQAGILRLGTRHWQKDDLALRRLLETAFSRAVASGIAMGIALYAGAPFLATRIFEAPEMVGVLRALAPAPLLMALLHLCTAATRLSQRVRFSAEVEDLAQPALNLALFAVLYALGFGLAAATLGTVASFGLAAAFSLWYVRRLFAATLATPRAAHPPEPELMSVSLSAMAAAILNLGFVSIDRLLLGYFRSPAEAGIYQAMSQCASVPIIVLGSLNAVLWPMFSRLHQDGQRERLAELFRVSTKWGLYLCVPVLLVTALAPRHVVAVMVGAEYAVGTPVLVILTTAQLVNIGTGAVGPLLVMTGHHAAWMKLMALMLLLKVALSVALIPTWGMTGSAVAAAVAMSALFIGGLVLAWRRLRLWPYDRRYWKGALAGLAAAGSLAAVQPLLPAPSLLPLLILAALATVAFFGVLAAQGMDPEDREHVMMIGQRFMSRMAGRA